MHNNICDLHGKNIVTTHYKLVIIQKKIILNNGPTVI